MNLKSAESKDIHKRIKKQNFRKIGFKESTLYNEQEEM